MTQKKLILIVIDGLGDRPLKELKNRTPLDTAKTHALDQMSRHAELGLVQVIENTAPESDAAVLSLLGYTPSKFYTGRGPLEAVGSGIDFEPGNLVMRANFATTSNGKDIVDRRVARTLTDSEAKELENAINKIRLDVGFEFRATTAHRGILVLKEQLSPMITNTDPAYAIQYGLPHALPKYEMKIQQSVAIQEIAKAQRSAQLVNEFTAKVHRALDKHPVNKKREQRGLLKANAILLRDPGTEKPRLFNISEKFNKTFTIIADMPLE